MKYSHQGSRQTTRILRPFPPRKRQQREKLAKSPSRNPRTLLLRNIHSLLDLPVPQTTYTPLYLDCSNHALSHQRPVSQSTTSYCLLKSQKQVRGRHISSFPLHPYSHPPQHQLAVQLPHKLPAQLANHPVVLGDISPNSRTLA